MIRLGVIADDFTGATDIASFLVENGVETVQFNGVPTVPAPECQAIVISLKTRACPPETAVSTSLSALDWLKNQGCTQIYFKYCSTFDSTARGNIGPVTDALMDALETPFTVFSPALPVNGRTVYQGYLFVQGQLLSESGMRHHPVNPMTDSYLPRLVEAQSRGRCAVIPVSVIERGAGALREALTRSREQGYRYAVLDTLDDRHLAIQGEALCDWPLITGGSGLAAGLARHRATTSTGDARQLGYPLAGPGAVLSGSCSSMTQRQVEHYQKRAPTIHLDIARCIDEGDRMAYAHELVAWFMDQHSQLAPLIAATTAPEALADIQRQFGAEQASLAVEALFAILSAMLADRGVTRFIVAGGETSGVVTQSLGITGFHIGPPISPGVPWVNALDKPVSLALKSGNFGDEAFFSHAQEAFPV
jgi:uncharacterized protein YgbK (DUF1537 family)